jgi:hypothetical protein
VASELNRNFSKEEIQMGKKQMKNAHHALGDFFSFFKNSFIHMCIHCLGHFSPLVPSPPSPPSSLPGRTCSALFSNFVGRKM